MGLDLKLLPVEGDWEKEGYSQTVLTLEQCPDLFCSLSDFSRQFEHPVPAMFNTYLSGLNVRDEHYGNTQKTGTGDPLRMGPVRELLRFSDHPGVYEEPQNRAVWAYLRELPEESMVALYWD